MLPYTQVCLLGHTHLERSALFIFGSPSLGTWHDTYLCPRRKALPFETRNGVCVQHPARWKHPAHTPPWTAQTPEPECGDLTERNMVKHESRSNLVWEQQTPVLTKCATSPHSKPPLGTHWGYLTSSGSRAVRELQVPFSTEPLRVDILSPSPAAAILNSLCGMAPQDDCLPLPAPSHACLATTLEIQQQQKQHKACVHIRQDYVLR